MFGCVCLFVYLFVTGCCLYMLLFDRYPTLYSAQFCFVHLVYQIIQLLLS